MPDNKSESIQQKSLASKMVTQLNKLQTTEIWKCDDMHLSRKSYSSNMSPSFNFTEMQHLINLLSNLIKKN